MVMTLSDVSRCPECRILSVIAGSPSVLRSLCHRPGPWLCPAAHSRVSRCPGCPRHASRDQVRDTGDTRHWPASTGRAGRPSEAALLISVSVRIPGPGHPSHPAIPDPPWSLVTIITPASCSSSPSSISRLSLVFPCCLYRKCGSLGDPSEPGPSSVSHPSLIMSVYRLHTICVMIASYRSAIHACFDA